MNELKHQKSVDKAISNLMKYAKKAPWAEREAQFFSEILRDTAALAGVPVSELGQTLDNYYYMGEAFGYLFELFATSHWDNEDVCMIEDYVKRRGWREPPHAKRYLTALAKSEVRLWEVVTVNVGRWVEVRPFGLTSKVIRVYERAASQCLQEKDCIAARVIPWDEKAIFGEGMLPFSPEEAEKIPSFLAYSQCHVIAALKAIRADDKHCLWSDEEINHMAAVEKSERLSELLFSFWTCKTYLALTKPMPTLVNREGHLLLWSKIRFPVAAKNREEIERRLHRAPHLDFDSKAKKWLWFEGKEEKVRNIGTVLLGQLSLVDDALIATVNSVERADAVKAYLNNLLDT